MNCVAQATLYDYSGSRLQLYLHRLGGNLFLEIQQYDDRDNREMRGTLIDLGAEPKTKAVWHENAPAVQGESGLWLPAVQPGDSVILDTPGAPAVKAVTAGDRVYREIEKKAVRLTGKGCTCPIFDLIAGGCTCGGFKAEKETAGASK